MRETRQQHAHDAPIVRDSRMGVRFATHTDVRWGRPGDGTLCVPACFVGEGAYEPGRNWWSNAVSAPYSWQELGSFGLFDLPRVGMSGIAY